MGIFNRFLNKQRINISKERYPQDTKQTFMHREQIIIKLEDLLNRVMAVKYDNKLNTEEKFAIVWSSLGVIQKISSEMLDSDKIFKEDEFDDIKQELKELFNKEKPNYVG